MKVANSRVWAMLTDLKIVVTLEVSDRSLARADAVVVPTEEAMTRRSVGEILFRNKRGLAPAVSASPIPAAK